MEAAGSYWMRLALALCDAHIAVSVINPAQAHDLGKALLKRSKTDAIDAQTLAELAVRLQPQPWTPPPAVSTELQQRLVHRDALVDARTQFRNQLHTANDHTLSFIASHTPYDSLSDLVAALITIVLTDTVAISVRWNTEPVEYEFRFATDASDITLTVIQWPDSTRRRENSQSALTVRGSRMEIVLPFWRALRYLESQATSRWEWQYRFPDRDMRKLDKHIHRGKHE